MGNIYFHIGPLESDALGVGTALVDTFYDQPVLTPPLAARVRDVVPAPYVEVEGDTVTLTPRDETPLRAWVVYRDEGEGYALERIVPAAEASVTLGSGSWAVSAAGRSGIESAGVIVEI